MEFSDRLGAEVRNRVVAIVGLVVLWQVIAAFLPFYTFPSIGELAAATHQAITNPATGNYPGFVLDTFRRLLIGFFLSMGLGTIIGTAMGLDDTVESFFRAWVVLGLSLPALAAAFVLILIFGITELVPVMTITLMGTPFVMLNMWEGAQELDPEIDEMASFFGASTLQRYRDIVFPQLLPYLFPSMYWGFVVCWKVLFIAEVFGAGSGVGYMVNYWFLQNRVDMLLGWVILPILVIILTQEGLRYAEDYVMPWRNGQQ